MKVFNFLPLRVRNVLLGVSLMIAGLVLALLLMSTFFVVSQFSGNAVFPVDCAVVFGSAVHKGGEAGPGIQRRTETAVHLMEEGNVERLIFTGGTGEGNRMSEARVMRNVALRMGVAPEFMHMEEGATSTWQNVKFVRPFVQNCDSVVGISDRYHLARIRFAAWQNDLDMMVHPADKTANIIFELRAIVREALGNVVYVFAAFS